MKLQVLVMAYALDLAIGDPYWLPHPVRGMGWMIETGERWLRRLIPLERLAGIVLVIAVVGTTYAGAWWAVRAASAHSFALGFIVQAALMFTCLSTRDLALESREVFRALAAGDLLLARKRVSRIVGRDTDRMDSSEVVRATLETIPESVMDGILSPLFYFVLGGAPLAMAYKAVNTLDSMIGHRSARYITFGWFAANVDTWANWLPARWSAAVFAVAARLGGYSARESWRAAWRDGAEGTVPNAGIPEAAFAGALGVRLGGVNWYQGQARPIAFMGEPRRPLEPQRIHEAIRLMYLASVVGWLMALGGVWLCAEVPGSVPHWIDTQAVARCLVLLSAVT